MKKIKIKTEYITLGQFLKFVSIIGDGGEAKYYLTSNKVFVNDELENRRGRKLYPGMKVVIANQQYLIVNNED